MIDNTNFFYNAERDDPHIGDKGETYPCVRDYKLVSDSEDLGRWRQMWYPSCRVCPKERFCYASHQMQKAKPEMII